MTFSNKSIQNIRSILHKSCGDDFTVIFTDKEIKSISLLVLAELVESLMMEIVNPELPTIEA